MVDQVTDSDTLAAVERWFRSRAIPRFIDHHSAGRDLFARVLAPLTAILMLELATALDATWVGSDAHLVLDGSLWGGPVVVTTELLRVAGFLTAFSGFYFTVYVLTDATYRKELLDEVLVQLRQAFAVRAVYLASRGA